MLCGLCRQREEWTYTGTVPTGVTVQGQYGSGGFTTGAEGYWPPQGPNNVQYTFHPVPSCPHGLRRVDTTATHIAHQSDDPVHILHCPWCGSGQLVARSDGTVECSFCSRVFTVTEEPTHSAMPQSVDGEPYDPVALENSAEDEVEVAEDLADGQDPDADEEPEVVEEASDGHGVDQIVPDDDDDDEDDEDDGDNPFAKKKSYQVLGGLLDEDAYLRHLALKHADDPALVLRSLREG